jgi:hypothetical protein
MAIGSNEGTAMYLSVSGGKLVQAFKTPQDGATPRVNKLGNTVYEIRHGWVSGYINDIATRTHDEFGKFWRVRITDGSENYIIEMPYSSGYANAFLRQVPNIDLGSPVKFEPADKKEGDKVTRSVFLKQHGQPLKWAFTKAEPNGMPDLKSVKVKGVTVWDDEDRMLFFEGVVKAKLAERTATVSVPIAEVSATDDTDLPF